VPLVSAAVLPHPPLIIPEVAAGAAGELDGLRAACDEAVARVLATEPATVCILGSGLRTIHHSYPFRASFADFGVPVTAELGPADDGPALPVPLGVGVWLLTRAIAAGRVRRPTTWQAVTVDRTASSGECRWLADTITERPSVALLVMGDGSACRTLKAPGYLDPRADSFDRSVTKALADADPAALLALDPALADELMAAGRAPWQVLASAAGQAFRGEVRYDDAPYGVQYTVATWLPG
jgi:hypothetical protein